MMVKKIRGIHIEVDPLFFSNIFEKNKRKMQKRLGIYNLTNNDFTKILAENNAQIKIPKQDNKYLPRGFKKRK